MSSSSHLLAMLERRLPADSSRWSARAREEIAAGVDRERFCALYSVASRYAPRGKLAPDASELARSGELLAGWNPERWTLLEAVRVTLILARPDLADGAGADAVEELFRYADVGELCAGYRALAHLPDARRFAWRAGEGARSNMASAFEAACCDTPYPALYFDPVAWRSVVIKCLFIGAPLWRVHGLDGRLDEELTRMALDLADERRSAGRPVNPETWMCLGRCGGERALESLERELREGDSRARAAAAIALARAGFGERTAQLAASDGDPAVQRAAGAAAGGYLDQLAFAALDPSRQGGL